MLHELVVAHIQTQDRTLHLRRNSDKVGEYLGIVGSWIGVHVIQHHKPQRHCANHDSGAQHDLRASFQFSYRRWTSSGFSSLSKPREPKRESKQRRQARIGQNWKRDHNVKAQQEPSGGRREHQAQRQAHKPGWKERPQNIERRGAARNPSRRDAASINSHPEIRRHPLVLMAAVSLHWIGSSRRHGTPDLPG